MEPCTTVPKRVVMVDDDAYILRLAEHCLRPPEFEVFTYLDPRDALMKLHDLAPDIIVSDVLMPSMDGRTFLKVVKRSHQLKDVPFIFLSGVRTGDDVIAMLDAGADDFLSKPFPIASLLAKIRATVRMAERLTDPGARPSPISGTLGPDGALPLLRFCEQTRVNGRVSVEGNERRLWVEFLGGEVADAGASSEGGDLERLLSELKGASYRMEPRGRVGQNGPAPTRNAATVPSLGPALRALLLADRRPVPPAPPEPVPPIPERTRGRKRRERRRAKQRQATAEPLVVAATAAPSAPPPPVPVDAGPGPAAVVERALAEESVAVQVVPPAAVADETAAADPQPPPPVIDPQLPISAIGLGAPDVAPSPPSPVEAGPRRRSWWIGVAATLAVAAQAGLGVAGAVWLLGSARARGRPHAPSPAPPPIVRVAGPVARPTPSTVPSPPAPAPNVLDIVSEPPGATVVVGRRVRGVTPLRLWLTGSTAAVFLTKDGFVPWSRRVGVGPGRDTRVEAVLTPLPTAAAATPEPTRPAVRTGDLVPLTPEVTPPRKLEAPGPSFKGSVPRLKRAASVLVEFVVTEHGHVADARIVESGGELLDRVCLEAVAGRRYEPAELKGVRVKVVQSARFTFQPR